MSTFLQLLDLTTGNLVTEFHSEDEAIEALSSIQAEEGEQPILEFALFRFQNGSPTLVAKQGELVRYLARVRHHLANQDDQKERRSPGKDTGTTDGYFPQILGHKVRYIRDRWVLSFEPGLRTRSSGTGTATTTLEVAESAAAA